MGPILKVSDGNMHTNKNIDRSVVPQMVAKIAIGDFPMASGDCI